MSVKNITNIAKNIFRNHLTSVSLTGNVIDIHLKELDYKEVNKFKNDCNELFSKDLIINIKSSI